MEMEILLMINNKKLNKKIYKPNKKGERNGNNN